MKSRYRWALFSMLNALTACAHGGPSRSAAPSPAEGAVNYPTDPVAFVTRYYVHSVPYDGARRLAPGATEQLRKMADDPKFEPFRSNIVVTLGMLADPASTDYLIWVARSGSGPSSPKLYTERTGAIMALGFLVNGSSDPKALDFLSERVMADVWKQVEWKSPHARSPEEQAHQLVRVTLLALALSGKPEAYDILRDVAKRSVSTNRRLTRAALLALREHRFIAEKGLSAYYRGDSRPDPERIDPEEFGLDFELE